MSIYTIQIKKTKHITFDFIHSSNRAIEERDQRISKWATGPRFYFRNTSSTSCKRTETDNHTSIVCICFKFFYRLFCLCVMSIYVNFSQ